MACIPKLAADQGFLWQKMRELSGSVVQGSETNSVNPIAILQNQGIVVKLMSSLGLHQSKRVYDLATLMLGADSTFTPVSLRDPRKSLFYYKGAEGRRDLLFVEQGDSGQYIKPKKVLLGRYIPNLQVFGKKEERPDLRFTTPESWRTALVTPILQFSDLHDFNVGQGEGKRVWFFDLDYCLFESSGLMEFFLGDKMGFPEGPYHLIPFRFDAVSERWSSFYLKDDELKFYDQILAKKDKIEAYMWRFDHPVYRRLSKESRGKCFTLLKGLVSHPVYTLGAQNRRRWARESYEIGVAEIARGFGKKMAEVTDENKEFWELLRKELYPDIFKEKKRRKTLAKSLFPRFTYRQIQALMGRMLRLSQYLSAWRRLPSMNDHEKRELFNSISMPFTGFQRLNKDLKRIREYLRPTFFRVCCSCYPLLLDASLLGSVYLGESKEKACHRLGLPDGFINALVREDEQPDNEVLLPSYAFLKSNVEKYRGMSNPPFYGGFDAESSS